MGKTFMENPKMCIPRTFLKVSDLGPGKRNGVH